MNNESRLYEKDVPARLRQVGIAAIRAGAKARLCVDPKKTGSDKVAFFVRTPQGKPDRTDKRIKEIVNAVAVNYEGKVEAHEGTLRLVGEKSTAKKAEAPQKAAPKAEEPKSETSKSSKK